MKKTLSLLLAANFISVFFFGIVHGSDESSLREPIEERIEKEEKVSIVLMDTSYFIDKR